MTPIPQLFLVFCFYAVAVRCEVWNDFNNCPQFFYRGIPPQLERHLEQPPKSICQRHQNQYHFATLYSTSLRIPLYSAYTLPDPCSRSQPPRRSGWFIEPQLSDTTRTGNMQTAGQQSMKAEQAINEDYENTGYDRGHLNPNSYQCDNSRTATFTLTNAVPQDPCFNQQSWKNMEKVSMDTMREHCVGAERYFVTGVVKRRITIPNKEHKTQENANRELNRVTVPSHMWTAACCYDPANQANGFSFAYIGKNTPNSIVEIMSVSELEAKLVSSDLGEGRYDSAKIFTDDCNENSQTSKDMQAHVSVPMDKRVANTLDNLSRVKQSTIPAKKRKLVHDAVTGEIASNKVAAYDLSFARIDLGITLERDNALLSKARELLQDKGASLLLYRHNTTPAFTTHHSPHDEQDANDIHKGSTKHKNIPVSRKSRKYLDALRAHKQGGTNDQASTPVEDEYLIVPDLSADASDVTLEGHRCFKSSCGFWQGTSYKWCYTDVKKSDWDYCCLDECRFRDSSYPTCHTQSNTYQSCSMRSSAIAVSGDRCLSSHECGLHGESYYWCYTDIALNWDYCCQPWHSCANYGEAYKWCYVGEKKESSWEYCNY